MSLWQFVENYYDLLALGTAVTIEQFLAASALAILIALILGLVTLSENAIARHAAMAYVEFFRGTSLIVQLFWIFFVLPLFGISLPQFIAGFVTVGMNLGAYGAELVRGGILAVPKGQWEAAYAVSLSPARVMYRIVLPQALLNMLPPWGNLLIELLKATALVSLISVTDLMFEAKQINDSTFLSAQSFGAALVIYYVLARLLLTPAVRALEHRLRRKLGRT
jgi:polar amino acid transport system permease protein